MTDDHKFQHREKQQQRPQSMAYNWHTHNQAETVGHVVGRSQYGLIFLAVGYW